MHSTCIEIMQNRFACKKYKETKIPNEVLRTILEAGRLSPSSFGLEAWHFHVCNSKDILDVCFNQESMKTAPTTIVVTCPKADAFEPNGAFFAQRTSRFPGSLEEAIEDFRGYHDYLKEKGVLDHWAIAQCYIAVANMMTAACEMGIQSCAIEGFNNDLLLERLDLDKTKESVGLVCAFGYPDEPPRDKIRMDFDSLVTFH